MYCAFKKCIQGVNDAINCLVLKNNCYEERFGKEGRGSSYGIF
jgi:hypothetical protein